VAAVYSTRLVLASVPAFSTALFTVPEGYTAVVRDIDAVAAADIGVEVSFALAGVPFFAYFSEAGTGSLSIQWRGRQVAYPGEELGLVVTNVNIDVVISGYLLTNP
jgi:hypothetical protein